MEVKHNVEAGQVDNHQDTFSVPRTYRRRALVKTLGVSGVLVVAHTFGTSPASSEGLPTNTTQLDVTSPQGAFNGSLSSYTRTFLESTAINFGWMGIREVTDRLKIPLGNASFESTKRAFSEKSVSRLVLENGIFASLGEEAVFRLIPSWILNRFGRKDVAWNVGLPITAFFAGMHNITVDEEKKKLGFALNRIPLGQLLIGSYFWKSMREKGFSHALLAHSAINTEQMILGKTYYALFPKKIDTELNK